MANYFRQKRFSIRANSREESKNTRVTATLGLLTLGIVLSLVFWGIPLLVNFAVFLGNIKKPDQDNVSEDSIPPVPPTFAAIAEATNTASINVGGSSEPESKVEIFLNQQSFLITSANAEGLFEVEKVPLQRGENFIYAIAEDKAGNKSSPSQEIKVTLDDKPPELEMEFPKENITVYDASIEIKGKTESDQIKVTVNDHLVMVENGGVFTYQYELAEGENPLKIVAIDLAGNRTEKEIAVTYHR